MNKYLKLSKSELLLKLNIGGSGLKKIEKNNKLNERLQLLGYKFIDKQKEGRQVFYILEQISEHKETYNNMCKYVYRTNKPEKFGEYFIHRTEGAKNNLILTNKDIAELVDVSVNTISNWNKTLINKNIICKDGYYYFAIECKDGEVINRQTDINEYKSYWNNKRDEQLFNNLETKFYTENITIREVIKLAKDIGAIQAAIEGKYVYRINKYNVDIENKLYIDTYELIKQAFKDKYKSLDINLIK